MGSSRAEFIRFPRTEPGVVLGQVLESKVFSEGETVRLQGKVSTRVAPVFPSNSL